LKRFFADGVGMFFVRLSGWSNKRDGLWCFLEFRNYNAAF